MNDRLPKSPAPVEASSFRAPRRMARRLFVASGATALAGVSLALTEGPKIAAAAALARPLRDGGEGENLPSPIRLWLNDQQPTDYVTVPNQEDDSTATTFLTARKTSGAPAAIRINSDFKPALTELLQERQALGRSPVEYLVAGSDLSKDLRGGTLGLKDEGGKEFNAGAFIQTTVDGALVCGWKAPSTYESYTEKMKAAIKANMVGEFVAALLEVSKLDIFNREGRMIQTPEEAQLLDQTYAKLGGANLFVWA